MRCRLEFEQKFNSPVDQRLHKRVRYAHGIQNEGEIVADNADSIPLRESPQANNDKKPLAIPRCRNQRSPSGTLCFLLLLDGIDDFTHLPDDERTAPISGSMVFCEDRVSFLLPIVGDEPSWRLWEEVESYELHAREPSLQYRWNTPRPVGSQRLGAECSPAGEDGAQVVHRPERRCVAPTVDGVGELCDEHGGRLDYQHTGSSNDESRDDELGVGC